MRKREHALADAHAHAYAHARTCRFINLLENLMEAPHTPALRGAAADCINEIVSKRMEAVRS